MRVLRTVVSILLLPSLLAAATVSASELEGFAEPAVVSSVASSAVSSPYYLVLAPTGAEALELSSASGFEAGLYWNDLLPPTRPFKVIDYSTPIRAGQGEMTLNLAAPGAGRAILSLALQF